MDITIQLRSALIGLARTDRRRDGSAYACRRYDGQEVDRGSPRAGSVHQRPRRLSLKSTREQGGVDGHVRLRMARGQMSGHISQVSVGTYTRAHAQGPGAHLIILDGEGYSLVWRRGGAPERYDWKTGTMFVPPNQCYQQHFNTGSIPARYLALETDTVAIRNSEGVPNAWISERLGGDRISYADESPRMRQLFAEALAARGLTSKMDEAYAAELRKEREVAPQSLSAPAVGQGGEQ